MPAESQKQQKFMNFVHAVQSGEASGEGYGKVEEAAKEMKPSSVEHFMGRGHIDKSLPEKVSSIDDIDRAERIDAYLKHKGLKNWDQVPTREFNRLWNAPEHKKEACDTCGCGKPHAEHTHEEYLKHMKEKQSNFAGTPKVENEPPHITTPTEPENTHKVRKMPLPKKAEDFGIGFMKAAIANGVAPLTAIEMLKLAGMGELLHVPEYQSALDTANLQNITGTAQDMALGGLGGGALGGIGGYLSGRNKEHPEEDHSTRNAILLGLLGAGGGVVGGGAVGLNAGANRMAEVQHKFPFLSGLAGAGYVKPTPIPGTPPQ